MPGVGNRLEVAQVPQVKMIGHSDDSDRKSKWTRSIMHPILAAIE
jgi:hypothetical protein